MRTPTLKKGIGTMVAINNIEHSTGIGFRHILEDGVAILAENWSFDDQRRDYVLNDLAALFDDARKGSELYERDMYVFDPRTSAAVRSCAFIERHLSREQTQLTGDLTIVSAVLQAIVAHQSVEQSDRSVARSILQEILENLELSGGDGLPEEPADIVWEK